MSLLGHQKRVELRRCTSCRADVPVYYDAEGAHKEVIDCPVCEGGYLSTFDSMRWH